MNLQKIYDYFFSNNYMTKMPSFGEVLASNVITLLLLLIILGLYVAGKVLLLKKIYGEKKMWQGAIPVLGLMKLYDAVELNKLFAISILIPVIGLIPYFIFCYKLPAAFGEKQPVFPYLTIFFSPIIMLMLATDQKYEYQYVRGKNIPFQGAFALKLQLSLPLKLLFSQLSKLRFSQPRKSQLNQSPRIYLHQLPKPQFNLLREPQSNLKILLFQKIRFNPAT